LKKELIELSVSNKEAETSVAHQGIDLRSRFVPRDRQPGFLYLLSKEDESKDNTYIGKTRNPLFRVQQQNRLRKGGAKSTRQAAPDLKLLMVIGPFWRGLRRLCEL
jgi:hypothetical protein